MGRKISVDILNSRDACEPGVRAFQEVFGEETVFSPTQEIAEKIASNDDMDTMWAADELTWYGSSRRHCPFVRNAVPGELARKISDLDNAEFEVWCKAEEAWYELPYEDRKATPFPQRVPSEELTKLRYERDLLKAMAFLKVYEEFGIGEKVKDSTWSVTDDFVDPNRQPAGDQASDA